jgi:uncharacterized UBP type Zn finger protein
MTVWIIFGLISSLSRSEKCNDLCSSLPLLCSKPSSCSSEKTCSDLFWVDGGKSILCSPTTSSVCEGSIPLDCSSSEVNLAVKQQEKSAPHAPPGAGSVGGGKGGSLAPDPSKPGPKAPTARGMRNLGNTCFFNAAMQILVHAKAFRNVMDSIKSPPHPIVFQMKKLVGEHWSGDSDVIDPSYLRTALGEVKDSKNKPNPDYVTIFKAKQQQDASEALDLIYQQLTQGDASIERIFLHRSVSVKQCSHPPRDSMEAIESNSNVQLILPDDNKVHSLEELLKQYTALTAMVKAEWPKINGKTCEATERRMFLELPKLLYIQIKRFAFDLSGTKIHSKVDVPLEIELKEFLRTPTGNNRYRLIGIVHHSGTTLLSGHYYADYYHYELKRWIRADDSSATPANPELVSATGYVFLYESMEN